MHSDVSMGIGMVALIFLASLAVMVFLIALFVAPIKLYSIHRELKTTNDLLREQATLLSTILNGIRFQGGLLLAISKSKPSKD